MLVLTHGSPASNAQRQVFQILHGWGTGPTNRRGVAVLGDGFARFGPVSGIICTPEAMAIIAALDIDGEGYLFAPLQGAWSVGGQQARISSTGANPVQEVDAALKRVVGAVRQGGLDPGYVQSLIVLDGAVSGVAQPETERGQGVVVAAARAESLLEAIDVATQNRSPGLTGAWTTADLTGVLGALGFDSSGLDESLLTGEGFPYSPYVLRPTSMDDVPFARDEVRTNASRALRSYAPSTTPPASSGEGSRETGPIPAVVPPVPVAAEPAGLLGPSALLGGDEVEEESSRPSPWRWLAPVLALLLVAAGVWFGASMLFGSAEQNDADGSSRGAGEPGSQDPPGDGGPAPAQEAGGYSFQQDAADVQAGCAAHSYGAVQEFFAENECAELRRALFMTEVDGKPVAVSLAEVTMPDADGAAALKAMTDTSGTGNVNDLLRDGVRPDGYPTAEIIIAGEYASSVNQTTVRIVEAAFVDGADPTPKVDAAADAALSLELPD